MRFGSKGLDAPTIIGIIVAVIIAIVIIYILWTRGLLPFAPAADRALCLSEILDACAGTKELSKVNKACVGIGDIGNKAECKGCILGTLATGCRYGESNFQACCDYIRGLPS
jgi:hypothetical protein